MRTTVIIFMLATGIAGAAVAADEDWTSLFDGKSLTNWVQKNGTAEYRVQDGTIVGKSVPGSPNSFLCTTQDFADFELEFEVKVDAKLNSGLQIRSLTKDTPTGRVNGPQVEIAAGGGKSGYIYGEATGRGWLTPKDKLIPHKKFKNGEWNKYRVVAKGPRIQTWINGEPVEDLTDEEAFKAYPKGFIGLQVHQVPNGSGPFEVAWRNIRIREQK